MSSENRMSLWGIGPAFAVSGVFIVIATAIFASMTGRLFDLRSIRVVCYAVGGTALLCGIALLIPAGRRINTCIRTGVLADRGVYGVVRNPIYSGVLFVLSGLCIASHTALLLAPPVLMYLLLKILLRVEERVLTSEFGSVYLEYKRRVNAIIPNPGTIKSAWLYPSETSRIAEGLYALRDRDVNAFVFTDGTDYVGIDTGYDATHLAREMKALGIDHRKIGAVFLTHADPDHQGGIGLFPEAALHLGREEVPMIDGTKCRLLFRRNRPIERRYRVLGDGEVVEIGNIRIEAIHTPGHTPGHMSYMINSRFLFSGDSIVYQNGEIRSFYRPLNTDQPSAVRSTEIVRRRTAAGIEYLCTAHTGVTGKVHFLTS